MSSVIGSLRVNLGLDSAKFESGARRVQSPLKAMKAQFLAVSTAAAALGGALVALTMATAKTATEIKQFSQIANAAPGEFQRWAIASKTVGIEQEKLADILKDVNDRVGDFLTTGGGPMKDFFEQVAPKIGITADAFRNLSGPQALQLYVSSLEKAGLSQQEMTFYLEAMASDTTALIPLLRDGGAAMLALEENARSLGGVMEDSTLAATAKLDLALGDVATSIRGVGFRISGELAPFLTVMAEGFANAMREGAALRTMIDFLIENISTLAGAVAALVGFLGAKLAVAMASAAGATGILTGAFVLLRSAIFATGFGALIIGAGYLIGKFAELVTATGGFGEALALLRNVAAAVFSDMDILAVAMLFSMEGVANRMVAAFLNGFATISEKFGDMIADFLFASPLLEAIGIDIGGMFEGMGGKAAAGIREAASEFSSAADSAFGNARSTFSGATATIGAIADLKAGMAGIKDETNAAAEAAATLANSLNDLDTGGAGGAAPGGGSLSGVKDKVDAIKDSANEMKDTFRTAFKDLATGAKNFGDVVKDVLNKIADRLLDSAFDNLWGAFSGGGTKKSGGGFLGSLVGSIFGSAKGNVFSNGSAIKAFAKGGIVDGPTVFPMRGAQTGLMGEAGPEAIVPLSRGRNGKLGIQSQGGGVAAVRVIGGDLTLTDNGSIMARVQVMDAQTANKAVGQAQASFRNSKSGWSP